MNWHALVPLVCLAANATLLTLVLSKGIYNSTRRVFAALLAVSILWNLFIFGMRTSPDAATALFWERLVALPAYFFPLLYYHFALLLARRKSSKPILVLAYVLGMVLVALGLTTDLVVSGVRRTAWAWSPKPGPLGVLLIVFMYFYSLLGVLVLFRTYRRLRSHRERNRLAYVLLGSSFIFLGGLTDLAPVLGIHVYPGTILGDVVFAVLITVAILRYELLDLKIVLRKGLLYALLGGLTGGAFLLVLFVAGKLFGRLSGQAGTVGTAAIVGGAAILLWPLWDLIQQWIDRISFPAHHNALLVVDELGQQATKILDLDRLASMVEKEIARAFRSARVRLLVYEDDRLWAPAVKGAPGADWERLVRDGEPVISWLQRETKPLSREELDILPQFKGLWEDEIAYWDHVGFESLIPLSIEGRLIAILALGPKSSGREYEPTEHQLLSIVTSQLAIAIENSRLYEQTDEKLRHRVAELTTLNTIAESLTGTAEQDEILESIVTRVAQVMEARICTIRFVEGDELTIRAAVGYRDEPSRQHTIKIDERLARIIRDRKPLVIEDLWTAADIPQSRRERAKHEEVHAFLGVPMISREKTVGILSIYGGEPHQFREEEVRLLSTVANQTAVAFERARLHEKIKREARELEQLVQERTKELMAMQVELLQSAKLAALGQLAAGVAHELNNPLGAISGYLELLQEGVELGPQGIEYMERIDKRIQQAAKIVAELKSLGTPSEPAWRIVDVNDILEETLALVERRLSLHQIKLQRDITPDLPLMHADPDRLEQVFINLITNARQAMEDRGTLKVTSRESGNGEWVEIIFADTGEGIAKEHLGKIFDPFFTTRSPGEAMGLGLSLSLRHIKDHGGAIDVWSEKGRGTVFRIALPPSGAKRCWEILDCDKKERCKAVREYADHRCWTVMEDVSRCEHCEVYRRKAPLPLDGSLLPG